MKKGMTRQALFLLGIVVAALLAAFFAVPRMLAVRYEPVRTEARAAGVTNETGEIDTMAVIEPSKPKYVETPVSVKGIYMSACAAASPWFRTEFYSLLTETELNSVVIDVKDYSGTISFPTDNPLLQEGRRASGCTVNDMREYVDTLHEKGIYVIGRISVFQDPQYAKLHPDEAVLRPDGSIWRDRKGLSFVDVGSHKYWDYIVELSKESRELGFDELNFDYIRFPSDGDMKNIVFAKSVDLGKTKPEALREFFAYLDSELQPTGVKTSADLFGMVTTAENDMGIGQMLEDTFPYFDYIAPMVYPSHYPPNFNGWSDPNAAHVVGPLVKFVMTSAIERQEAFKIETASTTPDAPFLPRLKSNQFRPWLQDNDYPVYYTPAMVRAQIQAAYDAGLNSWMLWDAGNMYTRSALIED